MKNSILFCVIIGVSLVLSSCCNFFGNDNGNSVEHGAVEDTLFSASQEELVLGLAEKFMSESFYRYDTGALEGLHYVIEMTPREEDPTFTIFIYRIDSHAGAVDIVVRLKINPDDALILLQDNAEEARDDDGDGWVDWTAYFNAYY